jgi:hypothetical protein
MSLLTWPAWRTPARRTLRSKSLPATSAAIALTVAVVGIIAVPAAGPPAARADSATYWFHGQADDQATKFTQTPGTATFSTTAPTGTVPITQTGSPFATEDVVGNELAIYWSGPFSGTVSGNLELHWWWSSPNVEGTVLGNSVDVSVFADPDYAAADLEQPQRVIGRATAQLTGLGPTPSEFVSDIPVAGTVASTLLIQVVPHFSDSGEGVFVHYDSTDMPSRFAFVAAPPTPQVVFDTTTSLAFAPNTTVSAHFLGAEPQTTIERAVDATQSGAVDADNVFVDWPLSTRTQTGQLARSTDGGDSFRMLLDLTCAPRNRPTCQTGGGGDTEEEVNLVNGHLFFADQVGAANEAVASSLDHGDTWPALRQFTISNGTTGTDRQWLAWIDPSLVTVNGKKVEAFLTYHLPLAGQYIQAITEDGLPVPQPIPQIQLVNQSGPVRVDNSNGPGRGWIYQIFRGGGGVTVGTAQASGYQSASSWKTTVINSDTALVFPWLQLDSRGNAYAVWVQSGTGHVFLSVSPIDDARNNPAAGGRPGAFWTTKADLTPPGIGSTIFPSVTAGDAGRIGVAFLGAPDCTGQSDSCALTTHWHTYAETISDALGFARGTPTTVTWGEVSHRTIHRGSVCTSGTTCTGDRSLLDTIDLGVDADGRIGVVSMDNNNRLAAPNLTDNAKDGPFPTFAKEISGPSLLDGLPAISLPAASGSVSDPVGDATWPNRSSGTALDAFDLTGSSVFVSADGANVVATVPLVDASVAGGVADLTAYNAVPATQAKAARIQYVVTLHTTDDVFHLDMETNANGSRRFFGGRVDTNDEVTNGAGGVVGARYVADAGYTVTGSVVGSTLVLRIPKGQLGLDVGSTVTGVTAFAMAAPSESDPTATVVLNSARTVDATAPYDVVLATGQEPSSTTAVDCTDPDVSSYGGWHVLNDSRAGAGTLCRVVGKNKGQVGAYLQLTFTGTAIDVVVAKGPRGGNFNASIDGGAPTKVDLYRAPADPQHPDQSGRKDLDFGVVVHLAAGSAGAHTLRIDVLNDSPDTSRDMVYVDGFVVTAGSEAPDPGGDQDVSTLINGVLQPGQSLVFPIATGLTAEALEVVTEVGDGVVMRLEEASEEVLEEVVSTGEELDTIRLGEVSAGVYLVVLENDGNTEAAFELWEVVSESR